MAPELPEKLLGIDIDDADDRHSGTSGDAADETVELERFVFFHVGEHRLALPVDDVKTITAVPDEMTRVPRTPAAIEGLTDLRGEITAVIDLREHFPATEDGRGRERLLVFDRPSDEQSAAVRADDVRGVDSVPKPNVLDGEAIEGRPVSGDALEHPLVDAILERERKPEFDGRRGSPATEIVDAEAGNGTALVAPDEAVGATRSGAGEQFDTGGETDSGDGGELPSGNDATVIEATPLLDVEKLLLASGHIE
ncbi:chemotaxis protein CheW [Natronococcus wangiae]|uniref:chemotaxis protein CheW n=1 Tax=Natronococcus wangiae TaxID=3068275 RepID=UPI00273FEF6B|nr:chemotaxis protein CheW [Natronococcus sp. AD5]